MAALAGVVSRSGDGRTSWLVFLLMVVAVTSSSLSFLALHRLVALRTEVEVLKSDISQSKRGQEAGDRGQTEQADSRSSVQERQSYSFKAAASTRKRRVASEVEVQGTQSFLQILPNSSRNTFRKVLPLGAFTGIPWHVGLRRGEALDLKDDRIIVKEDGFYFVYSQVYYMDSTFTMGQLVIRWKKNVGGNEDEFVDLFRCIQKMDPIYPYNTCYTGGIVKLEAGDYLELLIPRSNANVSLEGDSTFLGALKLV